MVDFIALSDIAFITSGKRPQIVNKESSPDCSIPVIGGGGPSGFTCESLYQGDILITGRVGTLGKLFAPKEPCWPSDNALVLWASSGRTDQQFLRYALQVKIAETVGMNRGAANPLITQKDLGSLLVYHPHLREQQEIGSLLGALDDKIELNIRMNESLESMALAIFKDWFVDFGPTRAKMLGREPYLAPDIWALFPDQLDDDGIPRGWCEGAISNFCNVKSGKRPPTKMTLPDYENGVPVYGGNGVSWYTNASLFDPPFIVTGRVGTLGTVFRVYDRVWVSDNALCCFPLKKEYLEYLYFVVSGLDFNSLNSGSTQPLLTQTALQKQLAIIARDEIISAFSQTINLLFIRIEQNISENQTLAQTRDQLLPKLMSGEIRVSGADLPI